MLPATVIPDELPFDQHCSRPAPLSVTYTSPFSSTRTSTGLENWFEAFPGDPFTEPAIIVPLDAPASHFCTRLPVYSIYPREEKRQKRPNKL